MSPRERLTEVQNLSKQYEYQEFLFIYYYVNLLADGHIDTHLKGKGDTNRTHPEFFFKKT